MNSRLSRRATAFLAACVLELLLVMVLVRSLRSAPPGASIVMVFVSRGLLQPARTFASASSQPQPGALAKRTPLPLPPMPDGRALPVPSARFPPLRMQPLAPRDWAGAAHRAAADAAHQAWLTHRRLAAMDELPQEHPQPNRPEFPWSHQPLTRWFDFDAHTLTASLHIGRRCEIVLFVILPGFGCVLGHIDDESRGDLFDPALLPAPLHLPSPPLAARQNPLGVASEAPPMP